MDSVETAPLHGGNCSSNTALTWLYFFMSVRWSASRTRSFAAMNSM